jgi:hypothetical protein
VTPAADDPVAFLDSADIGHCLRDLALSFKGAIHGSTLCDLINRRGNTMALKVTKADVWAATAARRRDLRIVADTALRWIDSPHSEANARRGFCAEWSLFWDAPDRDTVSIAAGALDPPTGLRTVREIYTEAAGDYYELDERVPSHRREAE